MTRLLFLAAFTVVCVQLTDIAVDRQFPKHENVGYTAERQSTLKPR